MVELPIAWLFFTGLFVFEYLCVVLFSFSLRSFIGHSVGFTLLYCTGVCVGIKWDIHDFMITVV